MRSQRHRSRIERPDLAPTIHVQKWDDDLIEKLGYDTRDVNISPGRPPYVETFWLPRIGPSALWLLRQCNSHLQCDTRTAVPTKLLAQSIGLGEETHRSSSISNTINRLEKFGFAYLNEHGDRLYVRTHLPPLSRRDLERLPEVLQALHRYLYWDVVPVQISDCKTAS